MKLAELLKEEFYDGYKTNRGYAEVFKNPSTKEIAEIINNKNYPDYRAVLVVSTADFYVFQDDNNIHDEHLEYLEEKGILEMHPDWYDWEESIKDYICFMSRMAQPFSLKEAESYRENLRKALKKKEKWVNTLLQKKNPKFKFIPE